MKTKKAISFTAFWLVLAALSVVLMSCVTASPVESFTEAAILIQQTDDPEAKQIQELFAASQPAFFVWTNFWMEGNKINTDSGALFQGLRPYRVDTLTLDGRNYELRRVRIPPQVPAPGVPVVELVQDWPLTGGTDAESQVLLARTEVLKNQDLYRGQIRLKTLDFTPTGLKLVWEIQGTSGS